MRWLLAALLLLLPFSVKADVPTPDGVVVIYIDDMGMDMFEHYGIGTPAITYTPSIAAFSDEGITFEQYAGEPVCTPSRAALVTGSNPIRFGIGRAAIPGNAEATQGLDEDTPNLIGAFRAAGYDTGCFGKWHLPGEAQFDNGEMDTHTANMGCNVFKGHLGNPGKEIGSVVASGTTPGYWNWTGTESTRDNETGKITTRHFVETSKYLTEYTTDAALEFLQGKDGSSPWFMYLAPNALHSPFHDASVTPSGGQTRSAIAGALSGTEASCSDAQPSGTPSLDCYYTMLANLDHELGLVKTQIEAMQTAGQDIHVYIASDNGTPLGVVRTGAFGGSNQKASINIGGSILPMIAWGDQVPNFNEGDVATSALIAAVDLGRTIAKMAGFDFRGLDSIDASGCITGDPTSSTCTTREAHFWTRFNPSDGTFPDTDHELVTPEYYEVGMSDSQKMAIEALGYADYASSIDDWMVVYVTDPWTVATVQNGPNLATNGNHLNTLSTYIAQGTMTADQYDRYKELWDYMQCLHESDGAGDRSDLCHERPSTGVADVNGPQLADPEWEVLPTAVGSAQIDMTVGLAYDPSGGIEYEIDVVTGGCTGRTWSSQRSHSETNLPGSTTCDFRYRAKDSLGNISSYSSPNQSATTDSVTASSDLEDSFTRSPSPDTDLNCAGACTCTGNDECDWTVGKGNWSIQSNVLSLTNETDGALVYSGDVGHLDHYSAVKVVSGTSNSFAGPGVRQEGSTNCHYQFRFNHNSTDYFLRSCNEWSVCTTFKTLTAAQMDDGTDFMADGDSLGVAVIGTGSSTEWKVFRWEGASASTDYDAWSAGATAEVCVNNGGTGGCLDWDSVPGCYADIGRHPTVYSGYDTSLTFDDWRGGLVSTPVAETDPPTPNPPSFTSLPTEIAYNSITMTSITVTDAQNNPVDYWFECQDDTKCTDSGWQRSATYTDNTLNENTQGCYKVKAKDSAPTENETALSSTWRCDTTRVQPPTTDCSECYSTDPLNPCTGTTTGDYVIGNTTFRANFSCSGGSCECGQWMNGEWWVRNPGASKVVDVSDFTATGDGISGGIEINTENNSEKQSQIVDMGSYYDAVNDLRSDLPLAVDPTTTTQSLITSSVNGNSGQCSWSNDTCIQRSSVLTVLDALPADNVNGSDSFRPPFAGTNKPQWTWTDDVRTDILPQHTYFTTNPSDDDLVEIEDHFKGAIYDKCVFIRQYRSCQPDWNDPDGTAMQDHMVSTIWTLINDNTLANKKPAMVNFMQHGIDRWGQWQAGERWPATEGQGGGRYEAMAFAATMMPGTEMHADVKQYGYDSENTVYDATYHPHIFADPTKAFAPTGHVWTSTRTSAPGGPTLLKDGTAGVLSGKLRQVSAHANTCFNADYQWDMWEEATGSRDCADWYGYTGPIGHNNDKISPGPSWPGSYMNCCWGPTTIALAGVMHMFPQLRLTVSYEPLIYFADLHKGTHPTSSHFGAWAYGPCSGTRVGSDDDDCDQTGNGDINTLDGRRSGESQHGFKITGNSVNPLKKSTEADPIWATIRGCEVSQTGDCSDWIPPSCGDGVCDDRGIFGVVETNVTCSDDCYTR